MMMMMMMMMMVILSVAVSGSPGESAVSGASSSQDTPTRQRLNVSIKPLHMYIILHMCYDWSVVILVSSLTYITDNEAKWAAAAPRPTASCSPPSCPPSRYRLLTEVCR
ncbi:hypothetical protein E2C01_018146 [Portunus trituberculatus]|uniref:Secreted protein n=1 Tax=Portunus trituberculatus TaxID=210409 RepID=A0A5B7DUB7_PORTR|nr:hypothetical protein [Portunus trituberculatus]